MKLFKHKANDEQPAVNVHNTPETEKERNLTQMLVGMTISLVGIIVAIGMLFLSLLQNQQHEQQQQLKSWSDAYLGSINQSINNINSDAQAVALHPAVISAIQSQDHQALANLPHYLRFRSNAVDVYLSILGQASRNHNREAPINYSALELIASAESGQQPAPEFILADGKRYLYKAAAVREPNNNEVIGSVLVIYDAVAVTRNLPDFADASAQFILRQNLPNAPELTLINKGLASSETTSAQYRTVHPHWTLVINYAETKLTNSTTFIFLLIALALLLLTSLGAIIWVHYTFNKQISKDCDIFNHLAQKWMIGRSIIAGNIKTPALRALVTSMNQTVSQKKAGVQPVATPPSTFTPAELPIQEPEEKPVAIRPAAQTSTAPTNPLHVDVLDIDIIDDDPFDLNTTLEEETAKPATNTDNTNDESGRKQVSSAIFRAYDIRGIVNEDLTTETSYWIGRAVGTQSIEQDQPAVVVARDGRLSGPELSEALIRGLVDTGCTVTDLGMVPTPVLYFATHTLEATSGIMVTGSHNPPDYNGFKVVIAGETLANEHITALYERIRDNTLNSGSGSVEALDILPQYLERIRNDVVLAKPLKVVVDCSNGVAGVIAPQLLEALGCTVIPLYCDVDGHFPNHHPDPSKPENLIDLIRQVKQHKANLGIAFDGDGDRLGVVTNTGDIIYPDRLMMLLAKDVISRNPGADIIFDIKCTRRLGSLISGYGGRPIMWKTGHSLIKAKMKETGALLAGEMSGHIFYKERWYGFDDGLYSAARLLEILALDIRNTTQIFAAFPTSYATPEITIEVTEKAKFKIIDSLQNSGQWGEGKINTLDGIRVDYPKGWGLIRASNTTPNLVLRFEGDTEEELEHIKIIFRNQLLNVAPIKWPFD